MKFSLFFVFKFLTLFLVSPSMTLAVDRCVSVFENKQSKVTDSRLLELSKRISVQKSNTKGLNLSEMWEYSSLFGDFQILISHQPQGLQWVVTPRMSESPSPVRHILEILLTHHFGKANVGYPIRPDGTKSEHLFVDFEKDGEGSLEAKDSIERIKKYLFKVPSRLSTNPKTILANKHLLEDLKVFGKENFPFISRKDFAFRAAHYIPYFIQKQPNHLNFALNADVFSTRELTEDSRLSQFLSFSMQQPMSAKELRQELRDRFVEEFAIEIQQLQRFRTKSEAWEKVKRHPLVIDIGRSSIILGAAARKTLPRNVGLVIEDYDSKVHRRLKKEKNDAYAKIIIQFKDSELPHILVLQNARLAKNKARGEPSESPMSFLWSNDPTTLKQVRVDTKSTIIESLDFGSTVSAVPLQEQGRDSLLAATHTGAGVNIDKMAADIGVEFFYQSETVLQSTPLSRLLVNRDLRFKIMALPGLEVIEDLKRFSAQDLVETYGFNRAEMVELLKELDVHAVHIGFDGAWDRDNMQLRKELPQYYGFKHAPGKSLNWHNSVPSDDFLNQ